MRWGERRAAGASVRLIFWCLLFLVPVRAWAALCSDVFSQALTSQVAVTPAKQLDLSGIKWNQKKLWQNWPSSGTTLTAGDYYFKGTTIYNNNYTLNVQGSGTVRIYVDGNLQVDGDNLQFNVSGNPSHLLLVVNGNVAVYGSNATVHGLVYVTGNLYWAYYVSGGLIDGATTVAGVEQNQSGWFGFYPPSASYSYDANAVANADLGALCSAPTAPAFPVFDDFSAYSVGSVNGDNGGTGWGGPWTGNSGQSVEDLSSSPLRYTADNGESIKATKALDITASNPQVAYRPLAATSTAATIYMGMLVRFNGSASSHAGLGFWLASPGSGSTPEYGIQMNHGNGSGTEDFFVSLGSSRQWAQSLMPGQTYFVVAAFTKGSDGYYDEGKLWVDPDCESAPGTPTATISLTGANQVSSISQLGLRSESLGSGESFEVGRVAAGKKWTDVVQCQCDQNGLVGRYYNNYKSSQAFPTTTPDLTRLDATVDFNWGAGSPDPVINDNQFAIEWDGSIEAPTTGDYVFQTVSDDGVRLWVNNLSTPIIDNWTDHSAHADQSPAVHLVAGQRYAVRMQYYENGGVTVAKLQWKTPGSGSFQTIPTTNLYACLPLSAPSLEGASSVCGDRSKVTVKFVQSSRTRVLDPTVATLPGNYSVVDQNTGLPYTVNSAAYGSSGYDITLQLASPLKDNNTYQLTVKDLFDTGGRMISPNPSQTTFTAATSGVVASYWNNETLSGSPVAQQSVSAIDNYWGSGSPIPGTVNTDHFSIRWDGYLQAPESGTYHLWIETDDGGRLYLDDLSNPIINAWHLQSMTWHSSNAITLSKGQVYRVRMEMYEHTGLAGARLYWQTPVSGSRVPVPTGVLFSCPNVSSLDHFQIVHSGSAVNCAPTPVTIQASASDGSAVTDYTGTISLSTSTGRGDWSMGSAKGALSNGAGDSGKATYTFATGDQGVATLELRDTHPETTNVNVNDSGVTESASYDPNILFSPSGFLFLVDGASQPIPGQISDKASDIAPNAHTLSIEAVRTDNQTGACKAFLTGTQSIDMGYECIAPGSCQTGVSNNQLAINGTAIAANNKGSQTNFSPIPLNFGDATTSAATFNVRYPDAGQVILHARMALTDNQGQPTGEVIQGSSNAFVTVPAGFCLKAPQANSDCTGSDLSQCSVFRAAGAPFTLQVQAVGWQSAGETGAAFCSGNHVTPNFQANNLPLTDSLVAPSGGVTGTLGIGTVSFSAADQGTATINNETLSEVGAFTFQLKAGQNYMGQSLPGGESATVGRFTPDHFTATLAGPGSLAPTCSSATAFAYTGHPMSWQTPPSVTVTALSADGKVTQNYTLGGFQKLQASDILRTLPTADSAALGTDGKPLAVSVTDHAAGLGVASPGVMTYNFSALDQVAYTKSLVARVAPFTPALTFSIDSLADSDGIKASGANPLFSFQPAASFMVRYGRMTLFNAFGPETHDLTVPFRAEYFDGSTFVVNGDDSCSSYDTSTVSLTPQSAGISTSVVAPGTFNLNAGLPAAGEALVLKAPGAGHQGDVRVDWVMPLWLQDDYNGVGSLSNPSAVATFGTYRGNDHIIYWREMGQ
ncbi:DUF6701 domain-containing protein [Mangrovitalea sediminis]|uniref:DUF6701 domain-containing protein n=1 Tax=Mangrovitalea sediminis TaxID=1982043 RepID=UPI000BE51CA1|nr:DUF6701 domain-containing protein [Mangrovitalea sediminis]